MAPTTRSPPPAATTLAALKNQFRSLLKDGLPGKASDYDNARMNRLINNLASCAHAYSTPARDPKGKFAPATPATKVAPKLTTTKTPAAPAVDRPWNVVARPKKAAATPPALPAASAPSAPKKAQTKGKVAAVTTTTTTTRASKATPSPQPRRLSTSERGRRRAQHLCFCCGSADHHVKDCKYSRLRKGTSSGSATPTIAGRAETAPAPKKTDGVQNIITSGHNPIDDFFGCGLHLRDCWCNGCSLNKQPHTSAQKCRPWECTGP